MIENIYVLKLYLLRCLSFYSDRFYFEHKNDEPYGGHKHNLYKVPNKNKEILINNK